MWSWLLDMGHGEGHTTEFGKCYKSGVLFLFFSLLFFPFVVVKLLPAYHCLNQYLSSLNLSTLLQRKRQSRKGKQVSASVKSFPQSLEQGWSRSTSPDLLKAGEELLTLLNFVKEGLRGVSSKRENEKVESEPRQMAGSLPRAAASLCLFLPHLLFLASDFNPFAPPQRKSQSQVQSPNTTSEL